MSDSLVDWGLADRLAVSLAGEGPSWDGAGRERLVAESEHAVGLVVAYTGLRPASPLPEAELVSRAEWVRSSIESFRGIAFEIEQALARDDRVPSGPTRVLASLATGAEVGLATAYLAQRVIGQYDVALIGPTRPPRLLFVAPNLEAARTRLGADPDTFLQWVALHESTHALQFAAVPWLRDYIGSLARKLLVDSSLEVKASEMLARLARLGPREILRAFADGELTSLFWSDQQLELIDRITAVMTVVEGYAEHVMDAAAATDESSAAYGDLRKRLERDRDRRGPLDQVVARLLGMDAKLAQYRRGRAFADQVAADHGIATLNKVWEAPETLPTTDELDSPSEWVERVGVARMPRLRRLGSRLRGIRRARSA